MKRLILMLLLAPFLLFSQPEFTITDNNGNVWDSNILLEEGNTIIIQFFSPSMTCWPSYQSIMNLTQAYSEYGSCNNKLFFIQVAEWGYWSTVGPFVEEFGSSDIPYVAGYAEGQELTIDWMDWGLQWAYECWILRPDGSYEYDIPYMWDLEQQTLINVLEDEGFSTCENTVGLEEYETENQDKTIYDITGRIISEIPSEGFYIQGGKKYFKTK